MLQFHLVKSYKSYLLIRKSHGIVFSLNAWNPYKMGLRFKIWRYKYSIILSKIKSFYISFTAISITRPSFSGSVSGYMPYVRYARVLNWDFLLTLRLKFTVDDDQSAIRSNLMLFSGQRGNNNEHNRNMNMLFICRKFLIFSWFAWWINEIVSVCISASNIDFFYKAIWEKL